MFNIDPKILRYVPKKYRYGIEQLERYGGPRDGIEFAFRCRDGVYRYRHVISIRELLEWLEGLDNNSDFDI